MRSYRTASRGHVPSVKGKVYSRGAVPDVHERPSYQRNNLGSCWSGYQPGASPAAGTDAVGDADPLQDGDGFVDVLMINDTTTPINAKKHSQNASICTTPAATLPPTIDATVRTTNAPIAMQLKTTAAFADERCTLPWNQPSTTRPPFIRNA